MLTTLIYMIGALSLLFTDATSPNGFFRLLLPAINALFFIFLIWQLIFFFAPGMPVRNDDFRFSDFLREFWSLNYNIEEYGFLRSMGRFIAHLINTVCFFWAVNSYLSMFVDFIE